VQSFQHGLLYWSPTTGAQPVWGALLDLYAQRGYENSFLGYPVGAEFPIPGGWQQNFQRGFLTWPPANQGGGPGGPLPKIPGTWDCPVEAPIKGNRGDNGWIYHVPSGSFYSRTDPEECFRTESDAFAAGYRRSQR
ncbi:LGFP repeat-containing protein, partial [Mariniluteicoccus endophyticus]